MKNETLENDALSQERDRVAVSVLFVCMGNICRSPMAEGVLRDRLRARKDVPSVSIDSAGTHGYHAGAPPDKRARAAASRRGIDISGLQARRFEESDFERFDYILAMDRENRDFLLEAAESRYHRKIHLLLDFARDRRGGDVPDPYYGGTTGFERVLDLVDEAIEELISELSQAAQQSR